MQGCIYCVGPDITPVGWACDSAVGRETKNFETVIGLCELAVISAEFTGHLEQLVTIVTNVTVLCNNSNNSSKITNVTAVIMVTNVTLITMTIFLTTVHASQH